MSYFAFLSEHGSTLLLGTVTTIKVLVCSTILYVIISMIFGLMRLSKNPAIQGIATVYIEFFRGTSLLVQLFWVYYCDQTFLLNFLLLEMAKTLLQYEVGLQNLF